MTTRSKMGLFGRRRRTFQEIASDAIGILNAFAVEGTLYVGHRRTPSRPAQRIGVETNALDPFMLSVVNNFWMVGPVEPDDAEQSPTGIVYGDDPKVMAMVIALMVRFACSSLDDDNPALVDGYVKFAYLDPTRLMFESFGADPDPFVSQMAIGVLREI